MSFKSFDLAHDVGSVVSAMNEVLTISSSLFVSGAGDPNVKTYTNISSGTLMTSLGGYWQTVYDSSPNSIQSTALFDITFGFSPVSSSLYPLAEAYGVTSCYQEKAKVYKEMASVLLGDSNAILGPNSDWYECFFIMIKRGIMKDELKKGVSAFTFTGSLGSKIGLDTAAASSYKQTVGGDYAPLISGSTTIGQVWYNAGIIVVPALINGLAWSNSAADTNQWLGAIGTAQFNLYNQITGSTIDSCVTGLRNHISNIAFQNQTNLYSTIYFCRATNTEFNYSSNPTYIDDTQRIRVTSGSNILQSRTYITKIGLYDANDNLLAVGSVNKPITKSPDTESIYRVRLDY